MLPAAEEFCDLFPAVYLHFCKRPRPQDRRLTPQMTAVLSHLSLSGPLTVGEMAMHFDRAQSVVSEIVDGLVTKGLLARVRDQRDRRRTLVWLSDVAHEAMRREREVLDRKRVAQAMRTLGEGRANAMVEAMRALVRSAGGPSSVDSPSPRPRPRKEKRS